MANFKINKIVSRYELVWVILIPLCLLLFCLRGEIGNFETRAKLDALQQTYGRFEFSGHAFESSRTRSIFLNTLSIAQKGKFDIPLDLHGFSGFDIGFSGHKA